VPTARQDLGPAAANGEKLYAVGGSAAATSAVVEEYTS
jgi:hypothetical protein